MNIKYSSPSSPLSLKRKLSTSSIHTTDLAPMTMSDVVADEESGGLDLVDTVSTDSTPFCRVYPQNNHKMYRCQQVKSIKRFISTGIRSFGL